MSYRSSPDWHYTLGYNLRMTLLTSEVGQLGIDLPDY